MEKNIDIQALLIRDQNILSASLDDELVLLSMDQNRYFGSGDVGRRIWEMCEQTCSVEQMVQRLLQEFEVEPAQCQAEVLAFCTQMLRAGLLNQTAADAGSAV